jgi:hypothetical protein
MGVWAVGLDHDGGGRGAQLAYLRQIDDVPPLQGATLTEQLSTNMPTQLSSSPSGDGDPHSFINCLQYSLHGAASAPTFSDAVPPSHPSPVSPTPSRPSTRVPPPPTQRSSGSHTVALWKGSSVAHGPLSPTVVHPKAGRAANVKVTAPPFTMAPHTSGCSARLG